MHWNNELVKSAFAALADGRIIDDKTGTRDLILAMTGYVMRTATFQQRDQLSDMFNLQERDPRALTEFVDIIASQCISKYGDEFFEYYPEIRRRIVVDDTRCDFIYACKFGTDKLSILRDDLRNRQDNGAWYHVDDIEEKDAYRYFDSSRTDLLNTLNTFSTGCALMSEKVFNQFHLMTTPDALNGFDGLLKNVNEVWVIPTVEVLERAISSIQCAAYMCGSLFGDRNFDQYYSVDGKSQQNTVVDLYYAILHGIDELRRIKKEVFVK